MLAVIVTLTIISISFLILFHGFNFYIILNCLMVSTLYFSTLVIFKFAIGATETFQSILLVELVRFSMVYITIKRFDPLPLSVAFSSMTFLVPSYFYFFIDLHDQADSFDVLSSLLFGLLTIATGIFFGYIYRIDKQKNNKLWKNLFFIMCFSYSLSSIQIRFLKSASLNNIWEPLLFLGIILAFCLAFSIYFKSLRNLR